MKTIYTFSLEDDVPQSVELLDQIKVFCYLLYDEIVCYETGQNYNILLHDGIRYNNLLDSENGSKYHYRFSYNGPDLGTYEPFMINDITFGFTVNTGTISDSEIASMMCQVKRMLKFNYTLRMNGITYMEDKHNKNRLTALKNITLENNKITVKQHNIRTLKPESVAI